MSKSYAIQLEERGENTGELIVDRFSWFEKRFSAQHSVTEDKFVQNSDSLEAFFICPKCEREMRIIVMHLTIILGGFLTMLLRTPAAALLLLIALKTATDLYAHRKEHSR